MSEGTIHFKVEDDGVGMEQEELDNLRKEIVKPCQDTGKGFGLANVNERIRMNFGAEYGMTIDSEQGRGTCVEIVIPAVPYEQAYTSEEEENMEEQSEKE